MHRRELKPHPNNPRTIDPIAFEKLVKIVRKHGLVQPPVWNKRSGFLVGGHQRLKAKDKVEGTDDYKLMVKVVDLDEKTEAELIVALNNQDTQGQWDLDKLSGLITEVGSFEGMGFDEFGLSNLYESMGGELPAMLVEPELADPLANTTTSAAVEQAAAVAASRKSTRKVETVDDLKGKKKRFAAEQAEKNDVNVVFQVVFASAEQKNALLDELGLDVDAQYIDGAVILEKLGIELGE